MNERSDTPPPYLPPVTPQNITNEDYPKDSGAEHAANNRDHVVQERMGEPWNCLNCPAKSIITELRDSRIMP